MTTIGKAALAAVVLALAAPAMAQQAGPAMQNWSAPNKPGDGVVEVVLADGVEPMACRVGVSVAGNGCAKVTCKGEYSIFSNSSQSIQAARRIAMSNAKAHYVHFLKEEIHSKRATDTISSAVANEGGANPGTRESHGYVTTDRIREQASGMISGFSVIEDGVRSDEAGKRVAYVIGGASCKSQQAAAQLAAGNPNGSAAGARGQAAATPAPLPAESRRRAIDNL
jgi:hypothetical protein